MNNTISEETIPACWVCERVWKRKDSDKWFYFNGMTICRNHPYARKWYIAIFRLAEQKCEFGEEYND